MRSIAEQSEDELGGAWSVLARQKRDHVMLDRLLDEVERVGGAGDEDVLRAIARLVFPHAFAEEAVLWPQLRRLLPDGEELTVRVEREHQEVNDLWSDLERADPRGPARREVIARLVDVLRQDVRDEEDRLLPRLQESMDARGLRRTGMLWEATRRVAPTRPHPVVSRRPPGNALSALPLSALDRARDRLDGLAPRAPARLRPALRTTSDVLGRSASAVERLRLLRRGERPSTRRI